MWVSRGRWLPAVHAPFHDGPQVVMVGFTHTFGQKRPLSTKMSFFCCLATFSIFQVIFTHSHQTPYQHFLVDITVLSWNGGFQKR
jgi:hypothetical protein